MTEEEKAEVKQLINDQSEIVNKRIESQERKLDELLSRKPWWHCLFNDVLDLVLVILFKSIILGLIMFYLIFKPLFS